MDVNKLSQTLDDLLISSQDNPKIINQSAKATSTSHLNMPPNNYVRRPSLVDSLLSGLPMVPPSSTMNTTISTKATIGSNPALSNPNKLATSVKNSNTYLNEDNYYLNNPANPLPPTSDAYYYSNNKNQVLPDGYYANSNSNQVLPDNYSNINGYQNNHYRDSYHSSKRNSSNGNSISSNSESPNLNEYSSYSSAGSVNYEQKKLKNTQKLKINTRGRSASDNFQQIPPTIIYSPTAPNANYNYDRRGSQDTMGSSLFSPDSSTCSNRNSTYSVNSYNGHSNDEPPPTASIKSSDLTSITLQTLSVDLVSGYLSRITSSGFIKKTSKRHFYVLDTKGLYYFKSNEPIAKAKGFIPFDKTTKLREIKESKEKEGKIIEIEIYKAGKMHLVQLQAEDPEDRDMWHRAIKKIIVRQKYVNEALPPLPPLPPLPSQQQQPKSAYPQYTNPMAKAQQQLQQQQLQQQQLQQQQLQRQRQRQQQQQQQQLQKSQPLSQSQNIYRSSNNTMDNLSSNDSFSFSNGKGSGRISPNDSYPEFIPNENAYSVASANNYYDNEMPLPPPINALAAMQNRRRPSFDIQILHSHNHSKTSSISSLNENESYKHRYSYGSNNYHN